MISALLIVFREMLEMALVVGVLLAATRGVAASRRWIGLGVLAGLAGAGLFALFMEQVEASFNGDGEFLFNAVVLLIASAFIAWTVFWMSRHGRELSRQMRQVGAAVKGGDAPFTALAIVSFAAVMREGGEAVFFLFGVAQSLAEDGWSMLIGGLLGAVVAVGVGTAIYFGLLRIPVGRLFRVVGVLLMLLAAGMASQAAANLVAIGWLPPLIDPLWNTSSFLPQDSVAGEFLRVLIGYSDAPSASQMLVFIISLSLMIWLDRRIQHREEGRSAGTV